MAIPCRHVDLVPDKCSICAVASKLSHMREIWKIQTPKMDYTKAQEVMKIVRTKPCEHVGKVISRADCNCPFKFVRACDLHGKCVIGLPFDGLRSCQTCPDYIVDS